MTKIDLPLDETELKFLKAYVEREEHRWRHKNDLYWCWRLLQEILEFGAVTLGIHRDSPEHEMRQVASIAMNWLRRRSLNSSKDRHVV